MGALYRARQRSLGRIVAVKVLLAGEFANPEALLRFRVEAQAVAQLQHPNIVALHEAGDVDGRRYYSMDFIDGPDLARALADGPMEPRRAARILRSLAGAMAFAHSRGILHRDLKPSNVLLDPFDEPRITDFGLAKEMSATSGTTLTGQAIGSPSFMPPEQCASTRGPVGPSGDI